MGKKRRGGGSSNSSSNRPSISTSVTTSAGSSAPPEPPDNEEDAASVSWTSAPVGPLPPPLVQLARYAHIANAGCAGRCRLRSALQAQAQAQPGHLSFRVTSAVLGRLPDGAGHVLVLALSTPQPTLLLRVAYAAGGSDGSSRPGAGLEEGDYLYEFLGLPSATVTAAAGAGGRRGVGGGLAAAGSHVACLALSEDGRRLLCVTREGNAHGLRTEEALQAATRVYDAQVGEEGGRDDGDGDDVQRRKGGRQRGKKHPWVVNPFGPSLLKYSMDPRYDRESATAGRRARDISLGSNSTEGDFEPHCCIWWTPAVAAQAGGRLPGSNMAVIGGVFSYILCFCRGYLLHGMTQDQPLTHVCESPFRLLQPCTKA